MIRFSKYLWVYAMISAFVLVPGMYSLIRYGLRPSIDFSGGTLVTYRTDKPVTDDQFSASAEKTGVSLISVQKSGGDYLVRMKQEEKTKVDAFTASVETGASVSATIVRNETVGPVLGKELLTKALYAAVLAALAILSYVAWAFKNIRYGVSAVAALTHDLLVVLGMFSLFGVWYGVEVDTLFVTAFLTTMSFSVHDTIVVFDRIREYRKRDASSPIEDISDIALTETMNRSLTNSFTIMFMLIALVLMGGDSIRWFAVALLVGTVSGTYSSPFVATPILLLWHKIERKNKRS